LSGKNKKAAYLFKQLFIDFIHKLLVAKIAATSFYNKNPE